MKKYKAFFNTTFSKKWVALLIAALVMVGLSQGWGFYRSVQLTALGDKSLAGKQYVAALHDYDLAIVSSPYNRRAKQQMQVAQELYASQISYELGKGYLARHLFQRAITEFNRVVPASPYYQDAKQKSLQAGIVLQALAVSAAHYQQGVQDYNAGQWQLAVSELGQVIQLDSNYNDAQAKLDFANRHLGQPRILDVTMSKSVGSQSQATAPVTTFGPGDSSIYCVMSLAGVLKVTALQFTRYFNGAYIDSGVVNPPVDYPPYFYFYWHKYAGQYPAGTYQIKIYINGYYQRTISYVVQ